MNTNLIKRGMDAYIIHKRAKLQMLHGFELYSVFDLSRMYGLCSEMADRGIRVTCGTVCGRLDIMVNYRSKWQIIASMRPGPVFPDYVVSAAAARPGALRFCAETMYSMLIDQLLQYRISALPPQYECPIQLFIRPTLKIRMEAAAIAKAETVIADMVPLWISWSGLPDDVCRVVGEYMAPYVDFFEQRLLLARWLLDAPLLQPVVAGVSILRLIAHLERPRMLRRCTRYDLGIPPKRYMRHLRTR